MDPDAALDRIIEAAQTGDAEELRDAADDLAGWLQRGGFAPKRRRLAELRRRIEAEDISYGELAELQDLARTHRAAFDGDMLLLEWAGVPEAEAQHS